MYNRIGSSIYITILFISNKVKYIIYNNTHTEILNNSFL